MYYRGFTQAGNVDLNASDTTSPTATVEQAEPVVPASAVATNANIAAPASVTVGATPAVAEPASAAPAAHADNAKDAQLVFSVSPSGVPLIRAAMSTDVEKQSLIDALTARFGKAYQADVAVTPDTGPATWLSCLKTFLPLRTVPGAEVSIAGSKVELSSSVADGKLGLTDHLNSTLGGMFQVGSFDINGVVASATQSFRDSMKSLLATDDACSGSKLIKVLDMQVVNFDRSSATVPESAYSTLDETARLLKNCAAKG